MNWKYVKPLKNELAVQTFLNQCNVILPDELVSVIETYNGGRPEEKEIVTDAGREYVFKSLLSYNQDDKETIYTIYPELFIDSYLFPIGSDSAGDFICYDLKKQRLVLLNHETNKIEIIIKMPF